MAELTVNDHTSNESLIVNSQFDNNKCWARLNYDKTRQCKNRPKNGSCFCGTHNSGFLKGTILTIHDAYTPTKPRKMRSGKRKLRIKKKSNKLDINRENYLALERYIIIIQRIVKGFLVRKNIKLRGIAVYCRHLCNNKTDCLSLKEVDMIPIREFYSYKDDQNFTWGFDIITINECIKNNIANPYNTKEIPKFVSVEIDRIQKRMKKEIKLELPVFKSISLKVQQRCVELFQKMDALKNYTKCAWFLELSILHLKKLYKEMEDLWNYRLQLSSSDKLKYTNDGKLFTVEIHKVAKMNDKYKLSNLILDEFEKLICDGKTESDRATACQWILSGLTLVHQDARDTLPWLYQSAHYS